MLMFHLHATLDMRLCFDVFSDVIYYQFLMYQSFMRAYPEPPCFFYHLCKNVRSN